MRLMTFATVLSIRQLTFFLAVSEFPWYQNYFSIQSTNFSLAYIWSYIYWSALSKIWLYCTQNMFSLYRRLLRKICTLIASIDEIEIAWLWTNRILQKVSYLIWVSESHCVIYTQRALHKLYFITELSQQHKGIKSITSQTQIF